jgi:hypothetical protein
MESEFYLQARRDWDERYGDLVLGTRNRGAGDRGRTGDVQLGKLAFYH